jgi:DnaJ-domain-containing protein 1
VAPLLLLAAAILVWAWWTGRLKGFTYEDMAAGLVFLLGLRFLTTGKLIPGAALMGGALLWAAWRRPRKPKPTMPVEDARRLLGVTEQASLAEIRDALVAEMNRRTPRAS